MATVLFNIMFYLAGLALASIPFVLDYFKSGYRTKPIWYKITIPLVILLLIGMGIIKTVMDNNNQIDTTNRFDKLNGNISEVKSSLSTAQRKYDALLRNLGNAGIKVDGSKITIENKTYNNKMRDVGVLNQ